jgi:hypothetical protein
MAASYPDWNNQIPHVDKNARPCGYRRVVGVRVIEVRGATFRGSQPLDGTFEIVRLPAHRGGNLRVEVLCAWHGVKPPTCYPHLKLEAGKFQVIEDYTGEVVDNIKS